MISTHAFLSGILFSASSGLISWPYQTASVSCSSSKELHKNLQTALLNREKEMNLWRTHHNLATGSEKTMALRVSRKSWPGRFPHITLQYYLRVHKTNRNRLWVKIYPLLSTMIRRNKRIELAICCSAQSETSNLRTLYIMMVWWTTIVIMRGSLTRLVQALWWRVMRILSKISWYLKWQCLRSAKSRWKDTSAIASILIRHKDSYYKLKRRNRQMQQMKASLR